MTSSNGIKKSVRIKFRIDANFRSTIESFRIRMFWPTTGTSRSRSGSRSWRSSSKRKARPSRAPSTAKAESRKTFCWACAAKAFTASKLPRSSEVKAWQSLKQFVFSKSSRPLIYLWPKPLLCPWPWDTQEFRYFRVLSNWLTRKMVPQKKS